MGAKEICELCGARAAAVSCGECEKVNYCSSNHQEEHWSRHKEICQPKVLEQSDDVRGRYLVAAKDIEPGELLFREVPIALGPRATSPPMCLGCHKLIEEFNFPKCPKCLWPLCSIDCASSKLHATECPVLAKDTEKIGQPINLSNSHNYDFILVLRCLLLRDTDTKAWTRLLGMASHAMKLANINERHHMATINYIQDTLKVNYDPKFIHHSRGAIMTNCFEYSSSSEVRLRGVYPKLGRINHSCHPNVAVSCDFDGVMYARAAVSLKALTPLSITYTGITEPLWERQAYIKKLHYFKCECDRCSDPSELGLHYSSPKCETCIEKYLEPQDRLGQTVWECPMCHAVVQDSLVKQEFYECMSKFDCNDTFVASTVPSVQNILEKVELVFHAKHHVWVMAAQVAIRTLEQDKTLESLTFRKDIWRRLLQVYSVLEPGVTVTRGEALYELGVCEASLTRLEMHNGCLTNHFFNVYMTEALDHLQEAIEILRLQPSRSHEQRWYRSATEEADTVSLDIVLGVV